MNMTPKTDDRGGDWKHEVAAERARLGDGDPMASFLSTTFGKTATTRPPGAEEAPPEYVESVVGKVGLYIDNIPPCVWAARLPEGARLVYHAFSETSLEALYKRLDGMAHNNRQFVPGYVLNIMDRETTQIVPVADLDIRVSQGIGKFSRGILEEVTKFETRDAGLTGYALIAFGPKPGA